MEGHRPSFKAISTKAIRKIPNTEVNRYSNSKDFFLLNMLFFGHHSCLAALSNPKRIVNSIFLSDETISNDIPAHHHQKIHSVNKSVLNKKLPPHTLHQGIVVDLQPLPTTSHFEDHNESCIVILDQVTDPHNVGAIIRSCVVFGVRTIIMTERHAPKECGVMAKTASGCLEHISFIIAKNLSRTIQELQDQHFWTVGLAEEAAKPLHEYDLKGKTALLLGSEGKGLRQKTKKCCDFYAYLPYVGSFSTLNVSNAASVALYEVQKQRL